MTAQKRKRNKQDEQPSSGARELHITMTEDDGRVIDAPEDVYRLTREVLSIVAEGGRAAVIELDHDLSTSEAADILGVSRPHLIKLLESGEMPYYRVGRHRRVSVDDVLAYKRRRALAQITAESQDLGLY